MKVTHWIAVLPLLATSAFGQLMASHASSGKAPAVTASSTSGKPIARVNGTVLIDRDLLREEYAMFPYARMHGGVPKSMEAQIRQGALDMIIFEELVYQDALHRKLTIPPAQIDRAEAAFRTQFSSREQYRQYLAAECKGSRQVLRERIRRSMLIDKLLKLEVTDKVHVTDAAVRAYYDKNPRQFQVAESFSIQSISILPPADATPAQVTDAKKRAEEAYRQAKVTRNYQEFGLLAEKLSEDDFRVNMGDHHGVPTAKMPPELLKIAATMKPGHISDLIQLGSAYTVFRLNAHTPAGMIPFEQVKAQLTAGLRKDRYNQLRTELNNRLRKAASIEVVPG